MKILIVIAAVIYLVSCAKTPVTTYDQYKPTPPPVPGSPAAPKPHVGIILF